MEQQLQLPVRIAAFVGGSDRKFEHVATARHIQMDVYHPNWSKRQQFDFQRLFELTPSAHLVVNSDLRIVAVSDKYLRITENQREKLIGQLLERDFAHNPNQPWIANARILIQSLLQVRQSGRKYQFAVREEPWTRDLLAGSSRRKWLATNTPILDRSGRVTLILHHLRQSKNSKRSRMVKSFVKRFISAQEKDRTRIARELHDQMAQYLCAISLELESLKANQSPEKVESGVEHIQSLIEHVGEDVHRLTWDLRPAPIEELGFRDSLYSCVEELSTHSSIQAFFHSNLTPADRFDPAVETICFRLIQEALANVVKHAHAKTASVIVTRQQFELDVIVEDDGDGFDVVEFRRAGVSRRHFGLQGMQERIKLVGGQLHIESAVGRGTSLFARIPTGD